MKLLTASIDKKLFKQYPIGSNLSKQEVVAKIFNPYGNQTWYIVNSDPEDPDYLWAILDFGQGAESGSVSRKDLESYRNRWGLGLERDIAFDHTNAQELYKGLYEGKTYSEGGKIENNDDIKKLKVFVKSLPLNTPTIINNLLIKYGGDDSAIEDALDMIIESGETNVNNREAHKSINKIIEQNDVLFVELMNANFKNKINWGGKFANGGTVDGKKAFNLYELKSESKDNYKVLYDLEDNIFIYESKPNSKEWILYDAYLDKNLKVKKGASHRMSKVIVNILEHEKLADGGDLTKRTRRTKAQIAKDNYDKEVDAYNFYVVDLDKNKAISGWEYKSDAQDEVKDNYDGDKNFKVVAKSFLKTLDIPIPNEEWKSFARGGSISKTERLIKEISDKTKLSVESIKNYVSANSLSDDNLLNIITGLGRGLIKTADVVTAITGNENNSYSKDLVEFAQSEKAFKLANGGSIDDSRTEFLERIWSVETDVRNKIPYISGRAIKHDKSILKQYAEDLESGLKSIGIKKHSLTQKDYDYYTDNNGHQLNEFLVWNDYFVPSLTKSEKAWRLAYSKDPKKRDYVSDPETITVKTKRNPTESNTKMQKATAYAKANRKQGQTWREAMKEAFSKV